MSPSGDDKLFCKDGLTLQSLSALLFSILSMTDCRKDD